MLSFALVLLVATSAYALPAVSVIPYSINDIPATPDNGRLVNKAITKGAFEYVDTGDLGLYFTVMTEAINSLADLPDPSSQAAAVLQTIAGLGELAYGVAGNSCTSAAAINAHLSGNAKGAVRSFVPALVNYIDTITTLVTRPNAFKFTTGPQGKCVSGGRVFDIDSAWGSVLDNSNVVNNAHLNEAYCSAKRLYSSLYDRSNNVAAAITAATLPPVNQAAQRVIGPLAQFLRVVANGRNPINAAAAAKNALRQVV
ncbi:fibroin light chain-like [Aricia agestis]|uniref:fibroin light chain-like n=1 Tax=Aricia agestis TaxID=91739 RepID=UPI001C2046DC|nr:fibroin light chain-like [Aricia agestis]